MAGTDRISELPADILDKIMILLPIQEVARMAVLSTFWRDIWLSLTHLNFADDFFGYMKEKHKSKKHRTVDIWICAGLYFINKVLMRHNGPIRNFFFHCPEGKLKVPMFRSFEIDQWLEIVTHKGVEEIHLMFNKYDVYTLPNCVLYCLTLKRLHLSSVIFDQINAPGIFPNVITLCIEDYDASGLPNCAVDLPMLENLSFTQCCLDMFNFSIATTPKLGSLTFEDCYSRKLGSFLLVNLDLTSVRTLVLDAYNIKEFVDECTRRGPQLPPPPLNVENLKLLSNEGRDYKCEVQSEVIHLLQMCPKIYELDIDLQLIGEVLYAEVERLRFRRGISISDSEKILFLTKFKAFSEELQVAVQKNKMLHTLKLTKFHASELDLLFIKALLAGFPALEKVFITPYRMLEFDEKIENIQMLLSLPCASTKAEIILSSQSNKDEDGDEDEDEDRDVYESDGWDWEDDEDSEKE